MFVLFVAFRHEQLVSIINKKHSTPLQAAEGFSAGVDKSEDAVKWLLCLDHTVDLKADLFQLHQVTTLGCPRAFSIELVAFL